MFILRLLGGFALLDDAGAPVTGLSQRRAEAVLALLALANDLGCTRDRLVSLLWPESDASHARHNLRSALHALRTAVGQDIVLASGDTLRLNSVLVATDVGQFNRAVAASRLPEAVDAYGGALLDGFHLDDAPEFERFIEEERARYYRRCADALELLAVEAERAGEWRAAVTWRQQATGHDPHNSRIVILLMRAMAKDGDPANALLQAELHRRRLSEDLEIEPDDELEVEVARIRREHANHGGSSTAPRSVARPFTAHPPPPPRQPVTTAALVSSSTEDFSTAATTAATAALAEAAVHALDATPPALASAPPFPPRQRRTRWMLGLFAALAIAAAAGAWWLRRPIAPLDPDAVAITPFSSSGGARHAREAEEIRDLIVRDLQDGPAPTAVELTRVNRAWSKAQGAAQRRSALAVDAVVAERTGASLVLRGSVDSTLEGTVLTLTLSRFPEPRVVARRAAPLSDGERLPTARRLLLEVLAIEADQPVHRLAELVRHPAAAVRAFLAGVRHPGTGTCRAMLTAVWRFDSTLVYPGLACLSSSGYTTGAPSFRDTVARVVWRYRDVLAREDAAFTRALVGPWFGMADDAEQRIALWETAAHAAPNWWVPWSVLAQELTSFGPRTTLIDWRPRARLALTAALDLSEWSKLSPLQQAFWTGIAEGDSALARRAMDADRRRRRVEAYPPARMLYFYGQPSDLTWVFDAAFGSGAELLRIRPDTFQRGFSAVVRTAIVLAQMRRGTTGYVDSLLLRWDRTPAGRQRLGVNYWIAAYWRTRGDYRQWREHWYLDYTSGAQDELSGYDFAAADAHALMWNVLHLAAPEDAVFKRGLARLMRIANGDSTPAPPIGQRGVAACWVSQWRLARGDTSGVAGAVALLRDLDARDRAGRLGGLPGSGRWIICPALLEAQRARVLKRGALETARSLDALMRPLPLPRRHWWSFVGLSDHDQLRPYSENLDVARLLADAGDTAAALLAVRRRPRHAPFQLDLFHSPTVHLRLEGRLASATLDTTGAIRAYEAYLALRPTPPDHPPWRAEWDSVRAELARIKKPRP